MGRECRLAGRCNTSYLNVSDFDRTTGTTPLRGNAPGGTGGGLIEGHHAPLKILFERLGESLFEKPPLSPSREELQTEPDLEDGDRSCPDRLRRLTVEPRYHGRVRFAPHERRDHIGIQEDHDLKSAGRTG